MDSYSPIEANNERNSPTGFMPIFSMLMIFMLCSCSNQEKSFDILILNGTVVDGTGGPRFSADIGIREGHIATMGDLDGAAAAEIIDATGKIVSPGFIDMHSHSDVTLLEDGLAQSAIRQGITTLVNGNCGSSPAPVSHLVSSEPSFETFGQYLDALVKSGTSANVCALVGHNAIRKAVMGVEDREPTKTELEQMKELVAEAMQSGAVGMSTGLVSPPGVFADTEEIIELAKVVADMGGLYATHMRGEASTLLESVREALRIGREAQVPVQISHHKAVGKENWGTTMKTLKMIERANDDGITVLVDVYPYVAGSANLSQFIPPWAHAGGRDPMLERLRDPEVRERVKYSMVHGSDDWQNFFTIHWEDIQIARVKTEKNRQWVGKRVADVARSRGISGYDACIDLILEEEDDIDMINFVIDEKEMQSVLAHPLSVVGSDGRAVSPETFDANPHPRFYGCFPRVLGRYCRDINLFDLEIAIHKMTGMVAKQLGIQNRGLIHEGYAADITIFDMDKVIDKATFENSNQYPEGIETVIVNGELVLHEGNHKGTKPGKIIKPERKSSG